MKLSNYTSLLLSALFIVSCSGFEEMNYDPNRATEVPTSGLLVEAQSSLVFGLSSELSQLGSQYVQHLTQKDYVEKCNYADDGVSSFTGIYLGGLMDLEEIIYLNNHDLFRDKVVGSGDNDNQIAVANILQAWAFHSMTDVWGDIPYSQALMGKEDVISPAYDTQEAIYDGLIVQLDDAIALINETPTVALRGDLIFDGNMTMWKKFASSLKLRIAMRLSEVNSSKADGLINDADFNLAFSLSSENAQFTHLDMASGANPIYADNVINNGADYFVMSNTLIDFMTSISDPRIAAYSDTAANTGTYIGLDYGTRAGDLGLSPEDISHPGVMYASIQAPSILMTAAEVLFIKAEAAQRGYISGDAATFYNDAITASMEYNGVAAGDIATYLAQPTVAYDAANWREKIGTQKWLALYTQGIQAWAEWRRLDFPTLTPPTSAVSTIPRRRSYTSDEYSSNWENVTSAVETQSGLNGQDLMTGSVWWDQ
jgi:hypothetical protein